MCAGKFEDGEVLVIRYEGPRGGPGMREMLGGVVWTGAGCVDYGRQVFGGDARILCRACGT